MKSRRALSVLTLGLMVVSSHALRADVRTDEKNKIEFAGMLGRMFNMFGGKGAREGVAQSIAVKGDRKASMTDTTGQIVDLAEEKVYDLDLKKKSYKVTTFAEIRRRMEEARAKAQADARKDEGKPQETAKPSQPDKQVEIDFDIKNTGQTKVVNGFDTHEAVVTVTVREKGKTLEQGGGLVMTSDVWLAPTIKEMKEIRDFDVRYAQKLYGPMVAGVSAEQMAAVMAMYPMMKDAMGKMNAEGGKIDGTPVLTTTTIDSVKSEEEMAQAQPAKSSEAETKKPTNVSGMLGSFAKKAAAKKMGSDQPPQARATFMTTTTEVLKVVTNVAAADVAVPAGFKEAK
ncbi:MAG TPA: hypothetical protein VH583_25455 [Vicinamibacterales bacterium]|jgi:hypothetical protein